MPGPCQLPPSCDLAMRSRQAMWSAPLFEASKVNSEQPAMLDFRLRKRLLHRLVNAMQVGFDNALSRAIVMASNSRPRSACGCRIVSTREDRLTTVLRSCCGCSANSCPSPGGWSVRIAMKLTRESPVS